MLHVNGPLETPRLALEPPALLFQHRLEIIDRLRRTAELCERHRLDLNYDHPRAFIDLPHIVVPVDADGMRKGGGVVVRPPFLDELAVLVEFPQHGCGAAAGNPLWVGTRVDKDVVLGVDVDADGLAHRIARNQQLKHLFLVIQLWRPSVDRVLFGLLFPGRNLRVNGRMSADGKKRGDEDAARAFHVVLPLRCFDRCVNRPTSAIHPIRTVGRDGFQPVAPARRTGPCRSRECYIQLRGRRAGYL